MELDFLASEILALIRATHFCTDFSWIVAGDLSPTDYFMMSAFWPDASEDPYTMSPLAQEERFKRDEKDYDVEVRQHLNARWCTLKKKNENLYTELHLQS